MRWVRRHEDMEGQANYLACSGKRSATGGAARIPQRALAVTAEEITDLARRFLDPDQAGIVVYRPESTPQLARDTADMRCCSTPVRRRSWSRSRFRLATPPRCIRACA